MGVPVRDGDLVGALLRAFLHYSAIVCFCVVFFLIASITVRFAIVLCGSTGTGFSLWTAVVNVG